MRKTFQNFITMQENSSYGVKNLQGIKKLIETFSKVRHILMAPIVFVKTTNMEKIKRDFFISSLCY